VWNMAASKQD